MFGQPRYGYVHELVSICQQLDISAVRRATQVCSQVVVVTHSALREGRYAGAQKNIGPTSENHDEAV